MPWLDLPSAIAASTSRSRGLSRSSGPVARRRPSIRPTTSGSSALPPAATRADRVDEALDVTDALLEQVPDSLGALADQLERVVLLVELREDEHAGLGPLPSQLDRRPQAVVAVAWRHLDVRDHDTSGRCASPCAGGRRRRRPERPTSNPASVSSPRDPLAQQHVVLADHHAQRALTRRNRTRARWLLMANRRRAAARNGAFGQVVLGDERASAPARRTSSAGGDLGVGGGEYHPRAPRQRRKSARARAIPSPSGSSTSTSTADA